MAYKDYIKYAETIASQYKTDQQHQVVALLVKGGKVINFGVNDLRYVKNSSYFDCSLHAEVDLIRKCRNELKGSKVFVYRFNNSGSKFARLPKCSIPCPMCQNELRSVGVGKVYCADSNGNEVVIRHPDLMQLNAPGRVITRAFLTKLRNGDDNKFNPLEYVVS